MLASLVMARQQTNRLQGIQTKGKSRQCGDRIISGHLLHRQPGARRMADDLHGADKVRDHAATPVEALNSA